jgi:hypothetical protein
MARVLTEGFEMGDTLPLLTNVACSIVTASTYGMSGNYALYMTPTYRGGSTWRMQFASSYSELYIRMRYQKNAVSLSTSVILGLAYNGTSVLSITIDNATQYINCGGQIGSTVINDGTTYLIEVHVKISATVGRYEVKVNGKPDSINFTGNTGTTNPNQIYATDGGGYQYGTDTQYWDDFAVNDTTTATDNGWCGDGHIIALAPTGNGNSSDWTGSDADQINNYLLVDDIPSNSDTDYVVDVTTGHKDLYTHPAMTAWVAGESVSRVYAECRARLETADGSSVIPGIRSNTTEDWSTSVVLGSSYQQAKGKELLTDPDTGVAWTESGVNNTQVGVKIP